MSEYQYYEWQALDRPLTFEEQAEVSRLSSHIDVTSTRAVVTYNWGNFKHNSTEVLARYFDAFLYHFNWGNTRLALRFPRGLLDADRMAPYLWEPHVELRAAGDYLILSIAPFDDDYGDEQRDEPLSMLAPLRNDILARGEPHLSLLLNRRLQELAGGPEPVTATGPKRTWAELRDTAARLRAEAERRAREAAEARRIRELESFAASAPKAWRDVDALIQAKTGRAYDEAALLLVKLRELAVYQGRLPEFQARLAGLQAQYPKRPSLLERLRRVAEGK